MGFGSGGGGFTPSPNNVPGSTQTGTDKDTDLHQFTGSVDITGSLTLNGSSVTGGGGGGGGTPGGANTQVQYNNAGSFAGSANFTFDGSTITVSDDSNITANIGKATVGNGGLTNAAVFAHRDFNNVNSYAFRQRAGTGQTDINAANGQPISFQQNGSTQAVLDASAQFGIGNGIVPSAVLHVSSSAGSDLFKVEHADSGDNPIFVITGSNGGRIGVLTDTPSAVIDIHPENVAGQNEIKIRGSAAVSHFYTTAGEDTYIRGGTQSSHVVLADVRNTTGTNNQKLSIGDAGNSTTAKMHLSSSDTPTVMTVTSNSGSILTALENQRVGIRTSDPTAALHVSSSGPDALFRIDHADQSGPEPILFVSGSGLIGIGTDNPLPSTPGDDTNRLHIVGNNGAEQGEAPVVNTQLVLENDSHAGLQFMFPNSQAGQITWGIPGNARKAVFYWSSANSRYEFNGDSFGGKRIMTMLSEGDSINIGSSSSGHMTTNKASLHISSSEAGVDKGGPVLLRVDHGDQPGAAPTLFVTGSGRVGIGTDTPEHALSVSGSAAFSGAFGSTAIETLTAAGAISATTGLTIIDASSSLAVDNSLNFTIADGTFVGQEKKIRAMVISGSTPQDSTGVAIGGANIDSMPPSPAGQITLSSSFPSNGPVFSRAGCTLIWDGTKWLPVGNFNFNINNTGRTFI